MRKCGLHEFKYYTTEQQFCRAVSIQVSVIIQIKTACDNIGVGLFLASHRHHRIFSHAKKLAKVNRQPAKASQEE